MTEEENKEIYKIGVEIGEIIGRYGTDKQIELFERMLEDYKIKNSEYFKLQKELDTKDICLKACEDNLIKERQLRIKRNKVIDLMAEYFCGNNWEFVYSTAKEVKEYFYKQVEVEDE